jgi:hypothetical protein
VNFLNPLGPNSDQILENFLDSPLTWIQIVFEVNFFSSFFY